MTGVRFTHLFFIFCFGRRTEERTAQNDILQGIISLFYSEAVFQNCFFKKDVLKSFAKFITKHLFGVTFSIKLQASNNLIKKGRSLQKDLGTDAFLWILRNFVWNTSENYFCLFQFSRERQTWMSFFRHFITFVTLVKLTENDSGALNIYLTCSPK